MGRLTKAEIKDLQEYERTIVVNGMSQVTHKKCIGPCGKVRPIDEFRKIQHRGNLTTCAECEQKARALRYRATGT